MTRALRIHRAGAGVTVQDRGRPGYLASGLSRGGAADPLALAEGAALLGQDPALAALELAASMLEAVAAAPLRIALTGAPMRATLDGAALAWNAVHALPAGGVLVLSPSGNGVYGYLHLGGGVDAPLHLGSRSAHLVAGLGARVQAGDALPWGEDPRPGQVGLTLDADPRFDGGTIRMVPSLQTELFAPEDRARFEATTFHTDARANRMGARLVPVGPGFATDAGLSVLSEVIAPGDIQITGDGTPFVLLVECQTTGGYPRIGSVLPCDLPRVAQAGPGRALRFRFVTLDEGIATERRAAADRAGLRRHLRPLVRDPADIRDLLAYQLIGGVTAGDDLERTE